MKDGGDRPADGRDDDAAHAPEPCRFAAFDADSPTSRTRLAPWRAALAQQKLTADLDGSSCVESVARACALSRSHFSKAFRVTVGMSPHRWKVQQRVARATRLLERSSRSLADIAAECGFADQSHFTRVFRSWTGKPPGRWRRDHVPSPSPT